MKKTTKKLMSLLFAILTAVTLVIPAMAASGSGYYGQYYYSWSVTRTSTSGSAYIETPYTPATVGTVVFNKIYNSSAPDFGWSYSKGSSANNLVPITGYARVTASASNVFTLNSVVYSGTVLETHGTFWVNGYNVEDDAVAE